MLFSLKRTVKEENEKQIRLLINKCVLLSANICSGYKKFHIIGKRFFNKYFVDDLKIFNSLNSLYAFLGGAIKYFLFK